MKLVDFLASITKPGWDEKPSYFLNRCQTLAEAIPSDVEIDPTTMIAQDLTRAITSEDDWEILDEAVWPLRIEIEHLRTANAVLKRLLGDSVKNSSDLAHQVLELNPPGSGYPFAQGRSPRRGGICSG